MKFKVGDLCTVQLRHGIKKVRITEIHRSGRIFSMVAFDNEYETWSCRDLNNFINKFKLKLIQLKINPNFIKYVKSEKEIV